MKRQTILNTLFKTTCIGILSGIVGSVLLYFYVMLDAALQARQIDAGQGTSYPCGTGLVALIGIIILPGAGAFFGLALGGFFICCKRLSSRLRPFP